MCTYACTHTHTHGPPSIVSPLLASTTVWTLWNGTNRAFEDLVEDLGKSWCFSGPLLAHFVQGRADVLRPPWQVPWCASRPGNRKTRHTSLQYQFYSTIRGLTRCVFFKKIKKKFYLRMPWRFKIEHEASKQFHTHRKYFWVMTPGLPAVD